MTANTVKLDEVTGGKLTGVSTYDGDRLRVTCAGVAEMDAAATLSSFLDRVHAAALRLRVKVVEVDFRALDFMNSSCFKAFVSLVGDVRDLPDDQRYMLRFVPAPGRHWQERSLYVLQCLAFECVQIEGSTPPPS